MTDVTGVDFVAIMTKDHDKAVKFYGETLGLPFVKQWGTMPGDRVSGRQPDPGGHAARRVRVRVVAERDDDRAAG